MADLKTNNADFATIKVELQNWYNKDKGEEIFSELLEFYEKEIV